MEATATRSETQAVFTERKTCRACASKTLVHVLSLGDQYLPRYPESPDPGLPRAPLTLVRCGSCGLLQLLHTTDPKLLFDEFWYRTGMNQTMREAMEDLIEQTLRFAGLKLRSDPTWLDIGANDGYLLSKIPPAFERVAVEPAHNFRPELEAIAHRTITDYFSARSLNGLKADVITSAACFYDVDDPGQFCRDIHDSLREHGVWVNQLNESSLMLKRTAFDSIVHEHLTYYSLHDLARLYRANGLTLMSATFNEVNGGSVRTFAMKTHPNRVPMNLLGVPRVGHEEVESFARRVRRWRSVMYDLLQSGPFHGQSVWCLGASTKGATLLQYLDMNERFTAIADRNPRKLGRSMCGIPILSEAKFRKAKPGMALVLPWAFRDEIVHRELVTRDAGTVLLMPLPNPELVL